LEYDRSFHVETFTFDMTNKVYGFGKEELKTGDFDTGSTQWGTFIKTVKDSVSEKDTPEPNKYPRIVVPIDKYNKNDVKPKLKCDSPCYNCFDSDPKFCTSCWGNKKGNKKFYL